MLGDKVIKLVFFFNPCVLSQKLLQSTKHLNSMYTLLLFQYSQISHVTHSAEAQDN